MAMVDNPLFVLMLIIALILVLLAVFTFFTWLFLHMAVNFKRATKGRK
jgi:hypothetical protein